MAGGTTPQRQIGRVLYSESDADVSARRWWWARNMTFGLSIILASLLPGLLGWLLLGKIPWSGMDSLGFILGTLLGLYNFANFAPKFIVSVPQAQAFVTLNPLLAFFRIGGDPNIVYGPGDSVAFPWETRSRRSNLSLEIHTFSFVEEVPGTPVRLITTVSYQFKVNIFEAAKFVGVNQSTIRGVIDLIRSRISHRLSSLTVDGAKGQIPDLNLQLGEDFGIGDVGTAPAPDVAAFEGQYGIVSVRVVITGIDLPEDVQRSRDAQDEATQTMAIVANSLGVEASVLRAAVQRGLERTGIAPSEYTDYWLAAMAQQGVTGVNVQAFRAMGLERFASTLVDAWIGRQPVPSALPEGASTSQTEPPVTPPQPPQRGDGNGGTTTNP